MKKLTNTNKYLLVAQSILILAVFVVARPVFAQYDTGSYDTTGYDTGSYDTTGYDTGSYDTTGYDTGSYDTAGYDTGSNYGGTETYGNGYEAGEVSYTYPDGTTYYSGSDYAPTYYTSGGYTVYSGGSNSGTSYYSYPYSYGSGSTVVYSGSASGGTPSASTSYTSYSPTTVYSGSASGGTSSGTTYYYPTTGSTVSSGTYTADNSVPNQVLAYSDTKDPQLSSVYLSDVPYTGAGDVVRIISFVLSLILWSMFVTFMILRRRTKVAVAEAKTEIETPSEISNESFISSLDSDSRDIALVESSARENRILLSTDAAAKLVKLERLGKAKFTDILKKASASEWTAIGEKDLEKYL